jgi:hypothetical protein
MKSGICPGRNLQYSIVIINVYLCPCSCSLPSYEYSESYIIIILFIFLLFLPEMDKKYCCEFLCLLVCLSGKDFYDSRSGNADVYKHEIPGGQYTNLQFQVSA